MSTGLKGHDDVPDVVNVAGLSLRSLSQLSLARALSLSLSSFSLTLSHSLSSIIPAYRIVFSTVPEYVGDDMSCCMVPWYDQKNM